jgi:4-amino-4-deoxy-L-arabinose transferase-like glycosyltransferase
MALSAAVTTDMALTLGVTAIMVGFWRALNADSLRQKQIWQLIGNLGWAVGFLSKGPLILVLAGMPIFLWTLLQRQWLRSLKIIFWLPGLTLLLLLTLPWYWAAENRTPGFLDYFIWGEHWHRFVDKGWSGDKYGYAHAEPLGSIWLQALVAWAPWTLLLPVYALIQRINAKHTEAMSAGIGFSRRFSSGTLYWLLFGLWPCIFFSFAGNILWTYVLPAVPAMAICLSAWSCRQKEGLIDILMMAGVLISGAILAVYVLMCRGGDYANEKVSLAVLEDYKQHNHHQKALYFYSGVPFSASFYTRGKALQAPSFDQMQLCSFLVMTDAESNQLTEPQRLGLKPISQHGSRRLYQWLGLPANEPQASKVDISGECD